MITWALRWQVCVQMFFVFFFFNWQASPSGHVWSAVHGVSRKLVLRWRADLPLSAWWTMEWLKQLTWPEVQSSECLWLYDPKLAFMVYDGDRHKMINGLHLYRAFQHHQDIPKSFSNRGHGWLFTIFWFREKSLQQILAKCASTGSKYKGGVLCLFIASYHLLPFIGLCARF